jgi:hypothetical protein
VIAQEHPELRAACVDLDPAHPIEAAAVLTDELLLANAETRIAWRDGVRLAERLARSAEGIVLPEAPPIAAERSILITGGFGALGLATARMLVGRGARHLILTGRSGAAGHEAEVAELEALGATVLAVRADVASAADAERLFAEIAQRMPALAGVIHAAGVLDDGVVTRQTLARLRKAMDPKVAGAWNLHQHTMDLALDFFVLFSSAASLLGSPGQANYAAGNAFLDALAHHRRASGLPGLSINWGGGMADAATARRRQEANGVDVIGPEAGFDLLARMLGAGVPAQLGVFPVQWARFGVQFQGAVPPLLEHLPGAAPRPAQSAAPRSWAALPAGEREPELKRLFRTELPPCSAWRTRRACLLARGSLKSAWIR